MSRSTGTRTKTYLEIIAEQLEAKRNSSIEKDYDDFTEDEIERFDDFDDEEYDEFY